MKKDIEKDALLRIGSTGNMTPEEVTARQEWLVKQSRQYLHLVDMEVRRLEQKGIMDQLGS